MFYFVTIVLFFPLAMIWGIYESIVFIKRFRARRNYKGATLAITEKVIPERRIEPSTWVVTSILNGGQVLLGITIIVFLLIGPKSDSILLKPQDSLTGFIVYLLCAGAVAGSGYLLGSAIVQTLLSHFSGVRYEAFSEQGVLYGGKIIAWEHFRGYAVSSENQYIYLLSRYYPSAIGFSFAPTSNDDFNLIISEIKKHLTSCDFVPQNQEVGIFMNIYFQAAFLSIGLLLLGLMLLMMPVEIGIILNTLLLFLHAVISVRIISRILPAGKFSVADIE